MCVQRKRSLALLVCAALLMAALFSVLFIVKEADHDCVGENCPICAEIAQAEDTLKKLEGGASFSGATALPAGICFLLALVCGVHAVLYATPVVQKVRMND